VPDLDDASGLAATSTAAATAVVVAARGYEKGGTDQCKHGDAGLQQA
jgi:hypothetical protein